MFLFTMRSQRDLTISEEVADEPPEEPEDELSFEIITEEEIASLRCPFTSSSSIYYGSSSSSSISSQGSSSSLGSIGTGPLTVIQNPKCQCQNAQKSAKSNAIAIIPPPPPLSSSPLLSEEELTASIRIWYMIQIKGHYHEDDNLQTTDYSLKRTGWIFSLRHLHEKIKQLTDRNRFDINKIPIEAREQLKHLYVY